MFLVLQPAVILNTGRYEDRHLENYFRSKAQSIIQDRKLASMKHVHSGQTT